MLKFSSFRRAFLNIKTTLYRSSSRNRNRKPLFISLAILALLVPAIFLYLQFARTTSAAWYNDSWLYRKELVFNNTASGTNLTDFPVMVKLTSANFNFSQAQSAGQDLRFTDSDGSTLLSYEIEKFDVSGSEAIIWVKVPQIDSASATDSIYVYWGNNAASDSQSADNTWNTNYKGVYHLKDSAASTTVTDSSGNTNTITSSENTSNGYYQATGKIGPAFLTGGTPTYITNQSGSNISEQYPDIVLDSSGFPVIAYYDATNQDLVLVHCNDKECKGGDENVNTVDSSNDTGRYPTIQLDGSGYPMIAYQYVTGLDLKYVHCNDVNCAGSNETFTTIETSNNIGFYPRMVLDASGYPVISHYSSTGGDVRIYHCSHADCTSGTANLVDSTGIVGNNLHGTDLVLNSSGFPVLSYYDTTNTELKIATCSDANCAAVVTKSPLSTLGLTLGFYTSIELDGSGLPMIAYYNSTNTDLDFLHCDDVLCDGVENANRVILDTGNATMPSLEKNSSGLPIIAAHAGSGIYPRLYLCANTSCSSVTTSYLSLYNQYSVNNPINIKLDSNNNIFAVAMPKGKTGQYDAVLYTTLNKLERAYDSDFDFGTSSFSTSTWFKSTGMVQNNYLLSRYDTDQGFKVRLNYAGQPCFEIDDDSVWGADDSACSTNSQVVTNVDNGNATNATYVSMELDSSGYPVIAYYDNNANDLELIHCNDANCTGNNESFASIDSGVAVGLYNSMVLDSSGFPVIAYYDITNTDLKVVHCGHVNCTSGNTINILDSTGNVGIYPSIKLDASGFPIIAYTDTTNSSVKVVHCNDALCAGANETITTVVNTEDNQTRSNSALQLDSSGFPIIVFSDQTNDDLELVHCNDVDCAGANETRTSIETTNLVGGYASMVLDSSGFPVIAFWDETNFDLRVVHCGNANCDSGNSTNAITMTNDGELGFTENEIKLNSSGYPVILSQQSGSWSMALVVCNDANCSGNNETISRIRDDEYVNFYHSLELDSSNYPVLAYTPGGRDVRLIHMSNATTYTEDGNYDDGEWHHLVGVKNGTTSLTIYLDGVAIATDAAIAATGTLTSNSATLNLGQEIENGLGLNNWTGYLDEVQIDTTARSSDWVKAQYLSESNTFINQGSTELRYAVNLGIFTNNTGAIKNNLVAYYKFDEGFGTTANNSGSIGSAANGTLTNGPQWRNEGKFGKAIVLDGEYTNSDDYVTIPDHNSLDVQTGPFTVSAWINRQGATTVGGGNHQPIVGKARNAVTYTYLLLLDSTGTLSFGLYDGTNNPGATSITTINQPGWHHVVGVYDGTSVLVYIDGKLENAASAGAFSGTATNGVTEIGVWPLQHSTRGHFNGLIDDVKIYNAALTADEIKQDFNKKSAISFGSLSDTSALSGGSVASNSASAQYCVPGSTDPCSPPVAEWKFDENTGVNGSKIRDTSGNNNDLTIENYVSDFWKPCKKGSCMKTNNADATGTRTSVSDPAGELLDFSNTQDYSLSMWTKWIAAENSVQILYYKGGNSDTETGYSMQVNNTFNYKCYYADANVGARESATSTTLANDNKWHYVSCVMDRTGTATGTVGLHIFVDGILEGSDISLTELTGVNTRTIQIGETDLSYEFEAYIDDVKVYNYARKPSQIAWDYNQGKPNYHYKFDDCTGSSLKDSSGNGKTATITIGASGSNTSAGTCTTSGAWFDGAIGRFNSALDFDGTDDQASLAEPTGAYVFEQDFTVSIWTKTSGTSGTLIHKATNSGGTIFGLTNIGGNIYFSRYDGEYAPNAVSTSLINTNNWVHIVGIKKDSTLTLYINGVPEAVITDDITGGGSGTNFTTYIGNSSSGVAYFTGLLDDARVYNYALTPAQIKVLYNENSTVRFGP